MKRFAVYGYGYNQKLPTCFVFAANLTDAWEAAKIRLQGITTVTKVERALPDFF